eukprot:scaffold272630_cov19-Prasinocladus_malaysianus.AAC.1
MPTLCGFGSRQARHASTRTWRRGSVASSIGLLGSDELRVVLDFPHLCIGEGTGQASLTKAIKKRQKDEALRMALIDRCSLIEVNSCRLLKGCTHRAWQAMQRSVQYPLASKLVTAGKAYSREVTLRDLLLHGWDDAQGDSHGILAAY